MFRDKRLRPHFKGLKLERALERRVSERGPLGGNGGFEKGAPLRHGR
jgi:hypothetical protein